MVAVYRHLADGGPKPDWLQASDYIDAFGAQSVFGRPLGMAEMNLLIASRNMRVAFDSREHYRDKNGAVNWAEWGGRNPDLHKLLAWAEIEAEKEGI
jgi:hypothetical protein